MTINLLVENGINNSFTRYNNPVMKQFWGLTAGKPHLENNSTCVHEYYVSHLSYTITLGKSKGARSNDLFSGITHWNQFSETSIQKKSYYIYLSTLLLKHKNEKTCNIKFERQQSFVIKSISYPGARLPPCPATY